MLQCYAVHLSRVWLLPKLWSPNNGIRDSPTNKHVFLHLEKKNCAMNEHLHIDTFFLIKKCGSCVLDIALLQYCSFTNISIHCSALARSAPLPSGEGIKGSLRVQGDATLNPLHIKTKRWRIHTPPPKSAQTDATLSYI